MPNYRQMATQPTVVSGERIHANWNSERFLWLIRELACRKLIVSICSKMAETFFFFKKKGISLSHIDLIKTLQQRWIFREIRYTSSSGTYCMPNLNAYPKIFQNPGFIGWNWLTTPLQKGKLISNLRQTYTTFLRRKNDAHERHIKAKVQSFN